MYVPKHKKPITRQPSTQCYVCAFTVCIYGSQIFITHQPYLRRLKYPTSEIVLSINSSVNSLMICSFTSSTVLNCLSQWCSRFNSEDEEDDNACTRKKQTPASKYQAAESEAL